MPIIGYVFILLGLTSLGNGLWMMVSAETWYHDIPAAVPDTGPYNGHFIRDIGLAYFISGLAFVWCAFNLGICYPVHIGNTVFVAGHAAMHVLDMVVGRLPHSHWLLDAPVLLPGIFMLAIAAPPIWRWINPKSKISGTAREIA